MNKPHIKKTIKHEVKFSNQNHANKCLELADSFLSSYPELLYWTERNDSRKGLFYRYKDGLYKPCSGLEVDNMLLDYVPDDKSILLPRAISDARFQETMRNIKRRRFFYRDVFNQENIINFKNGFFDIVDGELIPHTMEIVSTIQLPYGYDPDAKCPLFMKVVEESLEGDFEKIMILQEFMGYCLTQGTKYERGLFIVGAAGSGKSTVLEAIEAMLGYENVSSIRMDMLADSRFTGQLLDKLANIDNEIPQDMKNYEEALKKIISGQKITVDTKFIPTYCAFPTCKLIFAANDLPHISDSSDGVFRRMLLLYFNNVVDRSKVDYDLKNKIKQNECPGVFNWAFEGLKRLKKNNEFTTSMTMEDQVRDLKLLNNSIYYFITENYEVTGNKEDCVEFNELYKIYKEFCTTIGAKGVFKRNVFGKEIIKCFIKKIDSDRKTIDGTQRTIYTGLREKGYIERKGQEQVEWEE
jgi:putative DNA primase/helicase